MSEAEVSLVADFTPFDDDINSPTKNNNPNWVWFNSGPYSSWITKKHYNWIKSQGEWFLEHFMVFNPYLYPALNPNLQN